MCQSVPPMALCLLGWMATACGGGGPRSGGDPTAWEVEGGTGRPDVSTTPGSDPGEGSAPSSAPSAAAPESDGASGSGADAPASDATDSVPSGGDDDEEPAGGPSLSSNFIAEQPASCDGADERWESLPFQRFSDAGMVEGGFDVCLGSAWSSVERFNLPVLERARDAELDGATMRLAAHGGVAHDERLCRFFVFELGNCAAPDCKIEFLTIDGLPAVIIRQPYTQPACSACDMIDMDPYELWSVRVVVGEVAAQMSIVLPLQPRPGLRPEVEAMMRGMRITTPDASWRAQAGADVERFAALTLESCGFPR